MSIRPANRINNVEEYYFSAKLNEVRQLQSTGRPVINLGVGNPDLATDHGVVDELVRSTARPGSHHYQPYRGLDSLREAFAGWYGRFYGVELDASTEVLPLMGSKEGIMHVSMAFADPGDRVLVPDPGYPTYAAVARLLGLDVRHYNLTEGNGWLPDLDELEHLCTDRCRIIWLNYPHMPSGTRPDTALFEKLVDFARQKGVLLAHDNPYSLLGDGPPESILRHDRGREHVVELNSLSKSHNMAGWRVGCVAGNAENIGHVLKVKSNFDSGMFRPIQEAAVRALQSGMEWFATLNRQYSVRRKVVEEMCRRMACEFTPGGAGMFVWARVPGHFAHCREFSDHLLYEKDIFITPGSVFGRNGEHYIRISLCAPDGQLAEALERVSR